MRQLIKFCLVGASSTIINQGILALLLRIAPKLPWWASLTVGFLFGVTNGFYWNRRWTFQAQNQGSSKRQFPKFVATNLIGLLLNLLITKGFLVLFTGKVAHTANPDPNTIQLASLCAIPLVVVWNFTASRLWTFRTPKTSSTALKTSPVAPSE
jgi:putative flippase GtrA